MGSERLKRVIAFIPFVEINQASDTVDETSSVQQLKVEVLTVIYVPFKATVTNKSGTQVDKSRCF